MHGGKLVPFVPMSPSAQALHPPPARIGHGPGHARVAALAQHGLSRAALASRKARRALAVVVHPPACLSTRGAQIPGTETKDGLQAVVQLESCCLRPP